MSHLLKTIQEKAKKVKKTIVLPEGNDERVVRAASIIVAQGIANIILLGNEKEIKKLCPEATLSGITIVDPKKEDTSGFASMLYELRKEKGMELPEAKMLVKEPMYFGVMLVKTGKADGLVAGAKHSTGDMLRPGLQIIKTKPGVSIVSSCFIMCAEKCPYGDSGTFVFADCAVNVCPSASQLADIAIASSETAKVIAGITEPRVAMLSFSTKCSARHPLVDKVHEASLIVKQKAPNLVLDGDLQLDAAIEPKVAALKAPNSPVAGKANVLIFPDLQSGNIGYKLVERLANFDAIGPICQGFNKPLNDLSRGCSVEDVINVVAITALQAN